MSVIILTGTATITRIIRGEGVTSDHIYGSGALLTLSPTAGPPCPPITEIDGGAPDTVYDPVYGTIDGGTP